MPDDKTPAALNVAECEAALIAKAAANGAAFVQFVSTPHSVSLRDPSFAFAAEGGRLWEEVVALHAALDGGTAERSLVVELERDGDEYRLRYSCDFAGISPARVVLDAGYRNPNDPAPGMPRPEGVEVTDLPTDPVVLAEIRALVGEFAERYVAITGTDPGLGEGSSEAVILAAETTLGFRLPEDLRALYRTVHADVPELDAAGGHLLGAQSLLPLDEVVWSYRHGVPGAQVAQGTLFPFSPVVFDADPPGLVRPLARSDWWLTFATDYACNDCAIDLDPGPAGRRGQLFAYGRDYHHRVGYVADSVTTVLRQVVAALRNGTCGYEDGRLELPEWIGLDTSDDAFSTTIAVGSGSVAGVVAGIEDPGRVQQLRLRDAEHVDLGGLAGLPRLRDLTVHGVGTVAGAFPGGLPIESLTVDGERIEVGGFGALPDLWHVKVSGGLTSVAALREAAGLCVLDLSGVTIEIADLELLSVFPALRVLTLNRAQWQRLREAGAIPRGLAAAELTGRTRLDDALAWHRALAR